MTIEPIPALQAAAQLLYPSLPERYKSQHTIEDFEGFLVQYLILSGDIIDQDQATSQGERHGFLNTSTFAFCDGTWFCDIPTIFLGTGCSEYLKLCLASIMVLGSLDYSILSQ